MLTDDHKEFPFCPRCRGIYPSLRLQRDHDGRVYVDCTTVSRYGNWNVPCGFDLYADTVAEAKVIIKQKWREREEPPK